MNTHTKMARSFGKIIWKGLTTKRWLSPTKSALRRAGAKADHKRQKKVRQKPGFFAFVCGFFGFFLCFAAAAFTTGADDATTAAEAAAAVEFAATAVDTADAAEAAAAAAAVEATATADAAETAAALQYNICKVPGFEPKII